MYETEDICLVFYTFSILHCRFNFGLGKRSATGEAGDQALVDLGWWGLSGPHGLFKKSGQPRVESIKRGAYSFGKC